MTDAPPPSKGKKDTRDQGRVARELGFVGRFGIVGIGATAVHLAIVWTLIRAGLAPPLLANLIAFLIAFLVSFGGHYHWTFRARMSPRRAAWRFFLIAVAGFLTNSFILVLLVAQNWIAPEWAAVVSTLLVPAGTFVGSRFWGFRDLSR